MQDPNTSDFHDAELTNPIHNLEAVLDGLNQVLLDQSKITRLLLTGILAGGHVLLEGLPGLGKTELVKGLARLTSMQFNRVQFTPDLLPGDITGSHVLQEGQGQGGSRMFQFQPGPLFANVVLCDEINRASPKTQSALLEAMAEHRVTVMGETHSLPDPFFVLATQNPIELEGTYPLPEAQVDRFLFKLHLKRPSAATYVTIARERKRGAPPALAPVIDGEVFRMAVSQAQEIHLSQSVATYIARLVDATHPDSELAPDSVKRYVRYGGSPRAVIALASAARAHAYLEKTPQAGFQAVKDLFYPIMNHRLILDYSARIDGVTIDHVLADILKHIDSVGKDLPASLQTA